MAAPVPLGVTDSFRFAFSSPRRLRSEIFGGCAVALSLIPEVLSFSIVAGLDPRVGLFSSVVMMVTISLTGGRPAMVSAAAGAVALVIAPLTASHGSSYVVAAVLAAGMLQLTMAAAGIAKLMRFVTRGVMLGFMNALGFMMFASQLRHLTDVSWHVYALVGMGLAVMLAWPRVTEVVPAPLVTIAVVTVTGVVLGWDVPDVADQGELPTSLPSVMLPNVPLTWETMRIVGPYAVGVALVGLMESLLTARLVDSITDSQSDKTHESYGQGIGNILSALIGGMGVCAMVGQTMVNVKSAQARTRLSTLLGGVFLLVLVVVLGEAVGRIPMAGLVAVMLVISGITVNWRSLNPVAWRVRPVAQTVAMAVTVVGTLVTHNLAVGVIVGVLWAQAWALSRKRRRGRAFR